MFKTAFYSILRWTNTTVPYIDIHKQSEKSTIGMQLRIFLLLIVTMMSCHTAIYAEVKEVKYRFSYSDIPCMIIKGNFEKKTLVDGDISIILCAPSYHGIGLVLYNFDGKYEKGRINGTFYEEVLFNDKNHTKAKYGYLVEVEGTISNNKKGNIKTTCKPWDWKCNLSTKVMSSNELYCGTILGSEDRCTFDLVGKVVGTVSETIALESTPPININIEKKSGYDFMDYWSVAIEKVTKGLGEKEPMRGMTIEMVKEIHSGDTGHAYRRTSQGKDIVVLTYGGGSDSLLGFAIKKARYEYTFVNGRLESYSADSGEIRQIW